MTVLVPEPVAVLASEERLVAAWEHVYSNDQQDGSISASVQRFADASDQIIERLAEQLRCGTYQPRPLTLVTIAKDDGGERELRIPVAEDRVVERAVAVSLGPVFDAHFGPSSFGYRSGLGVSDAVQRVVELRETAMTHGVRTDIRDCFPTIDRARLVRMIEAIVGAGAVLDLATALVERTVRGSRGVRRTRGLAQGGSLSPLLSNLYLADFDRELFRRGVTHVRYADDMVLLARSKGNAAEALDLAARAIARGGQTLSDEKTETVSFDEGFAFLGEEFTTRYPPLQEHARRNDPPRRSLYVGYQGAGVRTAKGRLLVERDDTELASVPQGHVGRVVLSGSVGFSAGARSWAMYNGIDVVLLSRRGSYMGSMTSYSASEAAFRRAQYQCTESNEWLLALAKRIVFGKSSNQRTLLLRYGAGDSGEPITAAVDEIERYRSNLRDAATLDEVRGLEGITARRYWEAFAELIPSELGFAGRVRNPPSDVVNAALGYGYAILLGECVSALIAVGLDPAAGCLHADHQRRPSMALDLMEEFRPMIVDAVVVANVRRRRLTIEHRRDDDARPGGVLLTSKGRKSLVKSTEDRLLTRFKHIPSGNRVTYRRAIQLQAAQIAASVRSGLVDYEPILWR